MNQQENITDFCESIGFRFIQPEQEPFRGYYVLDHYLKKAGLYFDLWNTILPQRFQHNWIKKLRGVPRMSTIALSAIINKCVELMPENTAYLNVGVWHGYSLLSGMVQNDDKTCIGVDNFSMWGGPKTAFMNRFESWKTDHHHFYEMDYEDYFRDIHKGLLGFYFYDGNHEYEHQLKGLKLAEPHFAKDCFIMVDDTNWDDPRNATLDFISESENDYDILFDQKTQGRGIENESAKHPSFWNGTMIIQKTN